MKPIAKINLYKKGAIKNYTTPDENHTADPNNQGTALPLWNADIEFWLTMNGMGLLDNHTYKSPHINGGKFVRNNDMVVNNAKVSGTIENNVVLNKEK